MQRTDTVERYIPPGTLITYFFRIEDAAGQRLDTQPQAFVYHDSRFQWNEISKEAVTISYYGPVKTRAELLLGATLETLNRMGPLLGADTKEPIRITMYNNQRDMLEALPPRSVTIQRELITEGQAFSPEGIILVLGSGNLAKGTVSHEVTHILVHRATENARQAIPVWLNEGLAEYGNIDPGFSYDRALEFAIANNRLLPIIFLTSMPGTPEDVIIAYGEAQSIVRAMIDSFGEDKMRDLMAAINEGRSMDAALIAVYGFDRRELDARWRVAIGAPPYVPSEERVRPTPIPQITLLPYSLTPQPQAEAVTTPTPEPTATSVASPTPPPQATLTPAKGGACSLPYPQQGGPAVDISFLALVVGLLGLSVRVRKK
ncbi:MAG: hypothetical protein HY666_06825 [Chloroflexi bacterium]|nr:hypothetical protein [Chloroflexota bacterium]